jgi:hypothetical protein
MSDQKIAAIVSVNSAATEVLLAAVVSHVSATGVKVAGLLAQTPVTGQTCNAGILRDITTMSEFSIRLSEPSPDTSCVLDARGVAAASEDVLDRIAECDLVVLSKFGKLEAGGSGLLPVFSAAKNLRKPVLTSVSGKHHAAWKAFAPHAAELDPDEDVVRDWCRSITER